MMNEFGNRSGKLFDGRSKRRIQGRPECGQETGVQMFSANHRRHCFQEVGNLRFGQRDVYLMPEFFEFWSQSQLMDEEGTKTTPEIEGIRENNFCVGKAEKEQPVATILYKQSRFPVAAGCCSWSVFCLRRLAQAGVSHLEAGLPAVSAGGSWLPCFI